MVFDIVLLTMCCFLYALLLHTRHLFSKTYVRILVDECHLKNLFGIVGEFSEDAKLYELALRLEGTMPKEKPRTSNTAHNEGNNPSNVEKKGQENGQ